MLGRPLLFMSSYAPLFALLAIRFTTPWLWISCAVLAGLGVAALWLLLKLDDRSAPGPHELTSVRDSAPEATAYLASYLLPMLTVATPHPRDVVAYAGFLVVAAVISLRSAVAQVNPLLYLLGYRVLSVTDKNGLHAYLIAKRLVPEGERVLATRFRDDVLVDRS